MTSALSATAFAEAVLAAANAAASPLVQGWPQSDREAPRLMMSPGDFLSALAAVQPKLVYRIQATFDPESELEGACETVGLETPPDPLLTRRFADITKRAQRREGEPTMTLAGFLYEGVLHAAQVVAEWSATLEDEFAARAAEIQAETEERTAAADDLAMGEIRQLAVELANHAGFNTHPASFSKRRFLASELFKGRDADALYRITELAEMISWVRKGGVQLDA